MKDPVPGIDIPRRRPKPEEPRRANPKLEAFLFAFDDVRADLTRNAERMETLIDGAPACFREPVQKVRDQLLDLCVALELR